MKSFLVLFCVVAFASAILEVDELRKMVTDPLVSARLKILDDSDYTPRSQIQQQLNEIVQGLSPEVQQAYQAILQAEQSEESYKQQARINYLRNSGAPEEAVNMQQQIYNIKNDYSLSKAEAKAQIRNLLMGSTWSVRPYLDD
uniref:DUF148 domain-containing protein n=1 Tax=Syphacia muris TaxID=451379 RepID=A0A0N5AWM5_9BILA